MPWPSFITITSSLEQFSMNGAAEREVELWCCAKLRLLRFFAALAKTCNCFSKIAGFRSLANEMILTDSRAGRLLHGKANSNSSEKYSINKFFNRYIWMQHVLLYFTECLKQKMHTGPIITSYLLQETVGLLISKIPNFLIKWYGTQLIAIQAAGISRLETTILNLS